MKEKKDFFRWMVIKEKLHNRGRIRSIHEGDVWWYAAGENIRTKTAALHQLKNIDVSRLYNRIGQVPISDYKKVVDGIIKLLEEKMCPN